MGDHRNSVLVVLPDAPGSARQIVKDLAVLAADFHVHAVDPPGTGGSAPLPPATRGLAHHADAVATFCAAITDGPVMLYGIGFGATLAAAVAVRHPLLARGLLLRGVVMPAEEQRQVLSNQFAPPMTIGAEGEHWYKTWLMLRDSRLYDPWFARGPGAVRTGPVDLDPVHLHDWTVDVVGAGARYADLVHAVLARDVAPVFNALSVPTVLWQHPHDARTLFGDPAQRLDRDLPCYQGEDLVTAMRQVQASMRS